MKKGFTYKINTIVVVPSVIVSLALVAGWSIFKMKPEAKPKAPEKILPIVQVKTVKRNDVRLHVDAQGTVVPRTETELVAEVSGRVIEVSESLEAGGYISKDQVLVKIDPRDYEVAVVQAEASIASAEAGLEREMAEADQARRDWAQLGQGEQPALSARLPQLKEAKALVQSSKASLDKARYDLSRTVVEAPYEGRTRMKMVDVGQYVTAGTALATVYAIDYVEVKLPLSRDELSKIDLPFRYRGEAMPDSGPKVELSMEAGQHRLKWMGQIVRTEGVFDEETRMVTVIARVEDPYGRGAAEGESQAPLAVGAFVDASIEGIQLPRVFQISRKALRGESQVYVVDSDNKIAIRTVEILARDRDSVYVSAGLNEGESVSLTPLQIVVNGMEVRVSGESSREETSPTEVAQSEGKE